MKQLPIGIQSFVKLRESDCLYIDKTKEIYQLTTGGSIYFLSRPRRFGKSLLVSTLDALFKGQKELFEGLSIYDQWDWTQQHPVIRLDFAQMSFYSPQALNNSLSDFLKAAAARYEVVLERIELSDRFAELIEKLHVTTGQQVVVLVDEYDKPITDHLSHPETMTANKVILHDFYQVLKASDEHLRFIFLTGVSKFSGVSIFSALNNINDITLNAKYASICGYTQPELESYFPEYLDEVAENVAMSREDLIAEIRVWYNGYSWDGKTPVYNPFSTLLFFENKEFANYWFRTGTPTFLIEMLQKRNKLEVILKPVITDATAFDSYDPACIEVVPLLFQTGYLTIKQKKLLYGIPQYTLDTPNSEVRNAFLKYLLNAYTEYPVGGMEGLKFTMQRQIREKDADGLEQSLRMLFAYIPNNLHIQKEAYYHSLLLLWMKMLDFDIQGEIMTNIGRIDAVWHQPDLTVVAEIKYHSEKDPDSLLSEAITQIRDRRYYELYLDRKVMLMGIAFTGKEVKCKMETINNN